jgi:hypothetical protein
MLGAFDRREADHGEISELLLAPAFPKPFHAERSVHCRLSLHMVAWQALRVGAMGKMYQVVLL